MLPYGRNSSRTNFIEIIQEQKGTCSTKHGLIKSVAEENGISDVKLILCLYQMNNINTPGIGNVLQEEELSYLPEAHCYISIADKKYDFTHPLANIDRIATEILEKIEIQPEDLGDFKIGYHQDYLKKWIEKENLSLSFQEVWGIREDCIRQLSQ